MNISDLHNFFGGCIDIEFILSMGPACRPAFHLKQNNLRYFSSPFDWMMSYSLKTIMYYIENGIIDFFKKFEVIGINNANYTVKDLKTGMIAMHSFKNNKQIEYQYDEFIGTMTNRYNKMINIFERCNKLCFISNRPRVETSKIIEFSNFMSSKYNKDCLYFNIINEKNENIDVFEAERIKIFNISFDDIHENGDKKDSNPLFWIGNTSKWNMVLGLFKLNKI